MKLFITLIRLLIGFWHFLETIEELETLTEKKRLPFLNKQLLESASESETDFSDIKIKKILPDKKKNLTVG